MFRQTTPILVSHNEEETIQFYTGRMGFTFRESHAGYLIFSRDGIYVHLWPCTEPEVRNVGCYIYVTHIDGLYREYTEAGIVHSNGPLELKPWGLRQFATVDNSGNIFYFA